MSRIHTNIPSLLAARTLSTGLKINSGKDDPSGLIAPESLRGRLGAFQRNTIATTVNALDVASENIKAADSAIRDADFVVETSRLTRAQILVNTATQTFQPANQAATSGLSLLR